MTDGSGLRLEKWYCDWVGPGGDAAIGYWAALQWRGLSLVWEQVTDYDASGATRSRWSLAGDPSPSEKGERIRWRAPAIGTEYEALRTVPPIAETLLECAEGAVRWRVPAPAARVRLARDGAQPREGIGYVERIELDVPPWSLPIRELRWGRWISADATSSMVWIDWRGAAPRTWVYHDGRRLTPAEVSDDEIRAPNISLSLAPRRSLHERTFGAIVERIPGLRHVVPASLLTMHQHTRLSLGRLAMNGSATTATGDAIHEVVVLP